MICTIAEFVGTWKQESEITARVLRALTDAALHQRVTAQDRSLGELAWHITTSIAEMANRTGLGLPDPGDESRVPASAAAIAQAYEQVAGALLAKVPASWTDATLQVEDDMYGMRWSRSQTLTALFCHEIHHRGQMSVLIRQAGLVVPSIYGPNREETAAYLQKG
jgi:uncharacterized damage-inducible protein DinB